jgi:hypothetical protein
MKTTHTLIAVTLLHALAIGNTARAADKICYPQVLVPATFQAATEKVVTHEASPSFATTPVQLGYGERTVKVADAYVEYEIIPAKFGEVTESIEVERERVEVENLPATYRTETKRVKTKEATQQWNPACASVIAEDASAVPPSCLLETPAEYQEVSRELVETPARTVKKIIPGKTQTVIRKVLLEPAQVIRKEVPAVYESIKLTRVEQAVRVVATPGTEQSQSLPSSRKIQAERFLKMPALCEDNLDAAEITQLQETLQQHGYFQGKLDGVLGTDTRTALTRFQQDNQLAAGAITLQTLQKLKLR